VPAASIGKGIREQRKAASQTFWISTAPGEDFFVFDSLMSWAMRIHRRLVVLFTDRENANTGPNFKGDVHEDICHSFTMSDIASLLV
jgi:hypothetical protein